MVLTGGVTESQEITGICWSSLAGLLILYLSWSWLPFFSVEAIHLHLFHEMFVMTYLHQSISKVCSFCSDGSWCVCSELLYNILLTPYLNPGWASCRDSSAFICRLLKWRGTKTAFVPDRILQDGAVLVVFPRGNTSWAYERWMLGALCLGGEGKYRALQVSTQGETMMAWQLCYFIWVPHRHGFWHWCLQRPIQGSNDLKYFYTVPNTRPFGRMCYWSAKICRISKLSWDATHFRSKGNSG